VKLPWKDYQAAINKINRRREEIARIRICLQKELARLNDEDRRLLKARDRYQKHA